MSLLITNILFLSKQFYGNNWVITLLICNNRLCDLLSGYNIGEDFTAIHADRGEQKSTIVLLNHNIASVIPFIATRFTRIHIKKNSHYQYQQIIRNIKCFNNICFRNTFHLHKHYRYKHSIVSHPHSIGKNTLKLTLSRH